MENMKNDLIRKALFYNAHLRGEKIKQNSQSRNNNSTLTSVGSTLKNQIKIKQDFQNSLIIGSTLVE